MGGSAKPPIIKQGLVQDYSQRLIEGNIYRQKLSRLKLYGSQVWGWGAGGSNEIIYFSISRKKLAKIPCPAKLGGKYLGF